MAKVKIFLEKGETVEDAENQLRKALEFHDTGLVHDREDYEDPAMEDLMNKLEKAHIEMYEELLSEVIAEVEGEYSGY